MCSFHICPAYDNIKSTIRLYDGVLFVTLKNQKDGSDVHITLNPSQASTLGEYLQVAGEEQKKHNFPKKSTYFGSIDVDLEFEDPSLDIDTPF